MCLHIRSWNRRRYQSERDFARTIATLIKIGIIYWPRGRRCFAIESSRIQRETRLAARKRTLLRIGWLVSSRGRPSRVPCGKLIGYVVETNSPRWKSEYFANFRSRAITFPILSLLFSATFANRRMCSLRWKDICPTGCQEDEGDCEW